MPVRVGDVRIDDAPEVGRLGGWRGNGPMRISHFMGKDGGGLCSTWTLAALAEKFAL